LRNRPANLAARDLPSGSSEHGAAWPDPSSRRRTSLQGGGCLTARNPFGLLLFLPQQTERAINGVNALFTPARRGQVRSRAAGRRRRRLDGAAPASKQSAMPSVAGRCVRPRQYRSQTVDHLARLLQLAANAAPFASMRCRITASFRASAVFALRIPPRAASRMPQLFNAAAAFTGRVRMTLAAS
jgi:hypothetical protein